MNKIGAEEMAQGLNALAALSEDRLQYSASTSSGSLVLVTIAQEDHHMLSSDLHRVAQMCLQMGVYAYICVWVCMCTYIKNCLKVNIIKYPLRNFEKYD